MKINKEAKDYVKNLFSNENMGIDGTEFGNLKSEILQKEGIDFIIRYDYAINKVIHKELYGEWNGSKKLEIKQNGLTEDGKIVLSGYSVFKYIDTKGVPLENILMTTDRNKYVIDWLDFITTSVEHKWKLKGTLVKIENGIKEVYGKEYSLEIMKRLNFVCKPYIDDL